MKQKNVVMILAAQSVRFEYSYVANPICSPKRMTMFSSASSLVSAGRLVSDISIVESG